ncbi:MAG: BMC domain-containing protein [Elusimicrobia bacterium]|nr:BMC domain-containing protein [Candidatus Obscuribacterium magneticum]
MHNAIGCVELSSLAKGYEVTDTMLKTAKVELLLARTVCPGKYSILIAGDVAEVTSSVNAGDERAEESLIDSFVIPNIHPDVFPAITGTAQITKLESLGLIETFSIASLIEAADAAAKTASVKLIEIKLAMAMGGKAYVTMTGSVSAVEAAVQSGAEIARQKGLLVEKVVIPQPRPELLSELI